MSHLPGLSQKLPTVSLSQPRPGHHAARQDRAGRLHHGLQVIWIQEISIQTAPFYEILYLTFFVQFVLR